MEVAEDIGFSADRIFPEEFPMAHAAQTETEAARKPLDVDPDVGGTVPPDHPSKRPHVVSPTAGERWMYHL